MYPEENTAPRSSTGYGIYAARALFGTIYFAVLLGTAPVTIPCALVGWAWSAVSDAVRSSDSWDGRYRQKFVHGLGCATRWSEYVTTSDGTRLAVDVWLPLHNCAVGCGDGGCCLKGLPRHGSGRICGGLQHDVCGPFPVVYHQARYYRSIIFRWPLNLLINNGKPVNLIQNDLFAEYVSRGIAVVSVDTRGTGASFGRFTKPWSPAERRDATEMLDWILEQRWCNGRIGLYGGSYEGTSGFLLSLKSHPAVLACVSMFPFWDIYRDIARPGSFLQENFLGKWSFANHMLDTGGAPEEAMKFIFESVNPAEDMGSRTPQARGQHPPTSAGPWRWNPPRLAHYCGHTASSAATASAIGENEPQTPVSADIFQYRAAAQRQHALNMDVMREMRLHLTFMDSVQEVVRDDALCCIEALNPLADVGRKRNVREAPAPGAGLDGGAEAEAAYLFMSGWFDQTALPCLKMAFHTPSALTYCLMGPWNHGGLQHVRMFPGSGGTGPSRFPHEVETADFFEAFLNNTVTPRHNGHTKGYPRQRPPMHSNPEPGCGGCSHPTEAYHNPTQDHEAQLLPATNATPNANRALCPPSSPDLTHLLGEGTSSRGALEPEPWRSVERRLSFGFRAADPRGWDAEERREWMGRGAVAYHRPKMRYFTSQAEAWSHRDEIPAHFAQSTPLTLLLDKGAPDATTAYAEGAQGLLSLSKSVKPWQATTESGVSVESVSVAPDYAELRVDPKADTPFGPSTNDRYSAMLEQMDLVKYDAEGVLENGATLVFMSPPLEEDTEVTGVPVASLVVSSPDSADAPLFAYLLAYALDEAGRREFFYVTEGCLRGACRALHANKPASAEERQQRENAGDQREREHFAAGAHGQDVATLPGVPLPTFRETDVSFLEPEVPVRVSFHMLPCSFLFRRGQGFAVMVAGADSKQFDCAPLEPGAPSPRGMEPGSHQPRSNPDPWTLRLHAAGGASYVQLPVPVPKRSGLT